MARLEILARTLVPPLVPCNDRPATATNQTPNARLQLATGQTACLLFQFRPARVEGIQIFLCLFHCGLGSNELGSITGDGWIFEFSPFPLQHLLSIANAFLDGGIFPCFHIRKLLWALRRAFRRLRTASRRLSLIRRTLAFRLPRLPLRVVGEAF